MNHYYQNIQGWFDFQNLYSMVVSACPDNSKFVEVGTWKGMSTAYLGVEIINSGKHIHVSAVDTFLGSDEPAHQEDLSIINNTLYEEFCNNIEPIKSIITTVRKSSTEAACDFENASLDFVFIDAGHQYDDIYADISAWLPKVKPGGWLAGHDYGSSEGVRNAVSTLLPDASVMPPNSWIFEVK
jgi:hypothetical protein